MLELALNLGWMAMAIAMCWLWVRHARREGPGRGVQIVSLALVLFTMFAVITMYDDMAMAQNPAETRCFQREDDLGAHANAQLHTVVASAPSRTAELHLNPPAAAVPGLIDCCFVKAPVPSSIQNRPPPAA